jgi:hypothetical protein
MEAVMEDNQDQKRPGLTFQSLMLILLLNFLVSIVSISVYDRFFSQKVMAFDIGGYMAEQKRLFFAGKITEEELLRTLDRVDERLRQESKRTLILNGSAVIKNGKYIKP